MDIKQNQELKSNSLFEQFQQRLQEQANPTRAAQQQAYMKSAMPFYGVTKPAVDELCKALLKNHIPADATEYRATLLYFFEHATHRELWYVALTYAQQHKTYITTNNIDVFIAIIRKAQWWDIIDTVAPNLIGKALSKSPLLNEYTMLWIQDHNMWVRRTALLAQLKYKQATDLALQEKLIVTVAHEKEFFIRKAIGWSLRELSKTNKDAVRGIIATHGEKLSGLSVREARKYL